jgi:hypothetical protein
LPQLLFGQPRGQIRHDNANLLHTRFCPHNASLNKSFRVPSFN